MFVTKKIRYALLIFHLSSSSLIKLDRLFVVSATLKENAAQTELSFTCNSFWQLTVLRTETDVKLGRQSSFPFYSFAWQFTALRIAYDLQCTPKKSEIQLEQYLP